MKYFNSQGQVTVTNFNQTPTTAMIKDFCITILKGHSQVKELTPELVKIRFNFSDNEAKRIVEASKIFFKTNRTGVNKSIYYTTLQQISNRIVQAHFA